MRAPLPALLLPPLLAACSDYGVVAGKPDAAAEPVLDVSPDAITASVCEGRVHDVTLENPGATSVDLVDIRVEGTGWTLLTADWPDVLEAGDRFVVQVESGVGDATLTVESNADPALTTVPLAGTADAPPTARIDAPGDGTVLASGELLTMAGTVDDAEDGAEALSITWTSDVDGELSVSPAAADGRTGFDWPAADRSPGMHLLTLEAVDACDQRAAATVEICQDEGYTVEELDLSSWNLEGSAAWNEGERVVELTSAATDQVGSAFAIDETVPGDEVEIRFRFWIGDGTGADGLSLTVLDSSRMTSFLGGTGCGIGYGGDASCTSGPALPGWSVEVDTYYNGGQDPTEADHLMLTFDGDVDDPAAWAELPEMEDTGWHQMVVVVSAPRVTISIDGTTYIDADLPGFSAFPGYVGFTAGTGSLTNRHRIGSLEVTARTCDG